MKYFTLVLALVALLSLESCYYDNEEDLYPIDPNSICDTTDVSYLNVVIPILEANCIGCHEGNFPSGNVPLDSHQAVADVGRNGQLIGSIDHQDGFSAMPPSGVKIDDCEIDQIRAWVAQGAKNN